MGQLHLLPELYQEVFVSEAVWREVAMAAISAAGAKETVQGRPDGWLKVQTSSDHNLIASLRTRLGAGEAEAIALAAEIGANLLLIDETDGRRQAKALGLTVTGTLGILLLAKQAGRLGAVKPVLDKLIQRHNFRLARNLYEQVLREAAETP